MSAHDLISVVVPVYNEETNIGPFYEALTGVISGLNANFELIFVDDGSSDRTYGLICELAQRDCRVKAIRFSRNFGSHAAVMAGLRWATGDAAVMISVDLQDPPELIPELIRRWQEGFHVVWAVREGRDDPWLKKAFAAAFYKLFRTIALPEYPSTGMDFGLFDRCVLESLKNLNELNHFITGMIIWLGFRQTTVFYHRQARHAGVSKWSFSKRIKNALDAIVSFSYVPIRFISYVGLFISLLSFLFAGFLVVRRVFFGLGAPGWPSVMVAVLFIGGLQLMVLGILGEYIWRGTEQVRGRPQYIVMEAIGFN
jgi:glycosyltransferase involved in cell wall biosynthesis